MPLNWLWETKYNLKIIWSIDESMGDRYLLKIDNWKYWNSVGDLYVFKYQVICFEIKMPPKITQEYVESSKHENDDLDQEPLRKFLKSRIISPIINVRTPRNAYKVLSI